MNRMPTVMFSPGIGPRRAAALEVVGRSSGRVLSVPLVVTDWNGEEYLVSMLGERANWVRNVRAAQGRAVLRRGTREAVVLTNVVPPERPPILRGHLTLARERVGLFGGGRICHDRAPDAGRRRRAARRRQDHAV
jgi:F420H(2)-dependent quinone reductase